MYIYIYIYICTHTILYRIIYTIFVVSYSCRRCSDDLLTAFERRFSSQTLRRSPASRGPHPDIPHLSVCLPISHLAISLSRNLAILYLSISRIPILYLSISQPRNLATSQSPSLHLSICLAVDLLLLLEIL